MSLRGWWQRVLGRTEPEIPRGSDGVGPADSILAESEIPDDLLNEDGTVKE